MMRVVRALVAMAVGAMMASGLVLGRVTEPSVVRGFLDVLGDWDPTLLVFMVGCVVPHLLLSAVAKTRGRAVLDPAVTCTLNRNAVDKRLVLGAALFGTGWGMVGVCPGPALATLLTGGMSVWVLAFGIAAGTIAYGPLSELRLSERWRRALG